MREPKGWHSRGYLPHLDVAEQTQFVTWRLADSLPASVIAGWQKELEDQPDSDKKPEILRRIESYCDAGYGACVLNDPKAGMIVQSSILAVHYSLCNVHAWTVMPNHVHVLLTPNSVPLDVVVKRIKGTSSLKINRIFGLQGRLWQPGYYDRLIRSEDQFNRTRQYIEWNLVKAKLCTDPAIYPWSSGNPRALELLENAERQNLTGN